MDVLGEDRKPVKFGHDASVRGLLNAQDLSNSIRKDPDRLKNMLKVTLLAADNVRMGTWIQNCSYTVQGRGNRVTKSSLEHNRGTARLSYTVHTGLWYKPRPEGSCLRGSHGEILGALDKGSNMRPVHPLLGTAEL